MSEKQEISQEAVQFARETLLGDIRDAIETGNDIGEALWRPVSRRI